VLGLAAGKADMKRVVTFNVIGKGLELENAMTKGEAKLMAERAEIADGYRQLVEKIRGVYVDAFMKAGYGKVDMDVIKIKTQSRLRGVEIVEIKQGNHGIIEAHMLCSFESILSKNLWSGGPVESEKV
jgi:outer membrane protein FlgP